MHEPPLPLLIKITSKHLDRAIEESYQQQGITNVSFQERNILFSVYNEPGSAKASQIARAMKIPKSTLSDAVASLINRGYIFYSLSESDHREKEITLTDEGRAFCQRLHQLYCRFNSEMEKGLSEEELEIVKKVLLIIIENTKGGNNVN